MTIIVHLGKVTQDIFNRSLIVQFHIFLNSLSHFLLQTTSLQYAYLILLYGSLIILLYIVNLIYYDTLL